MKKKKFSCNRNELSDAILRLEISFTSSLLILLSLLPSLPSSEDKYSQRYEHNLVPDSTEVESLSIDPLLDQTHAPLDRYIPAAEHLDSPLKIRKLK